MWQQKPFFFSNKRNPLLCSTCPTNRYQYYQLSHPSSNYPLLVVLLLPVSPRKKPMTLHLRTTHPQPVRRWSPIRKISQIMVEIHKKKEGSICYWYWQPSLFPRTICLWCLSYPASPSSRPGTHGTMWACQEQTNLLPIFPPTNSTCVRTFYGRTLT